VVHDTVPLKGNATTAFALVLSAGSIMLFTPVVVHNTCRALTVHTVTMPAMATCAGCCLETDMQAQCIGCSHHALLHSLFLHSLQV
jgi:hypothetical protein